MIWAESALCLCIRTKEFRIFVLMTKNKTYKVAGHLFRVGMEADSFIWDRMEDAYGPFEVVHSEVGEVPEGETKILFSVKVYAEANEIPLDCDLKDWRENMNPVYSNKGTAEPGFIELSVYNDPEYHCFEFTQPMSDEVNGRLFIDNKWKEARLYLEGTDIQKWMTFTTGINFCYLLSTASHQTVLAHSSCVTYRDKAYMFLGKSGTGKSTHSRMWLNALEDVILMNDDHPVIRINPDGKAIAYGSPWSGKTRCYKNMEAPVGGIIRISRAPYNKARRLSPIESYASLMTSFSGMTWEKELADGRDKTIQGIIGTVPCWVMECLPDEDAARVCCKAVTEV